MHTLRSASVLGATAAVLFASAVLLPGAARAGGHDNWATTGKILTGVVGFQVLSGLAHGYRDRDYGYDHVYYYQNTYVAPPTVIYRDNPTVVYRDYYYDQPAPVSVYRPAAPPQVVYVQQPAPAPQIIYVQTPAAQPQPVAQPAAQEPAPPPQPAQEKPVVTREPAPAAAVQPAAPVAAMPATGDVDPNQYVVVTVEEGKRLIQPRQRGHAATMQMWSDVKKEWVDIKAYPSIW